MKHIQRIFLLCTIPVLMSFMLGQPLRRVMRKYPSGKEHVVLYFDSETGDMLKEEVYFESGRVQWSGDYKNGVEDGTWTFYYESGRVKVSETYSNGKEHGLRTEYDSSGRKVKEEQWKHGKLMKETRFQ